MSSFLRDRELGVDGIDLLHDEQRRPRARPNAGATMFPTSTRRWPVRPSIGERSCSSRRRSSPSATADSVLSTAASATSNAAFF
jgi:hypothetical protein